MPILQRIRFPKEPTFKPLYVSVDNNCWVTASGVCFEQGAVCNLDSFFNSCFLGNGGWPGTVGDVMCRLHLKGDFIVTLMARTPDGREALLHQKRYERCTPQTPVLLPPFQAKGEDLRVFPVLRALKEKSCLCGGEYTCACKRTKVRLGVVICTYRREEALFAGLEKLEADYDLRDIRIVIVDNAGTIDRDLMPEGVRLIQNPNLGGAGGFTRGMMALLEESECTHVLLMDDDVKLDAEAVFRCRNFFKYTPDNCLAGALLDPKNPGTVQEAGADLHPINPIVVVPHLANLNLTAPDTLGAWQNWRGAQYGGFWFFGFPMEAICDSGLLLPFFLKADDVEFGLRFMERGVSISIMAGVGVHHARFTGIFDLVKRYYWVRNMLIVRTLHCHYAFPIMTGILLEGVKELRSRRLDFLLVLVRGMEDFLKGPQMIGEADDTTIMASLKRDAAARPPLWELWERLYGAMLKYLLTRKALRDRWHMAAREFTSMAHWKRRLIDG